MMNRAVETIRRIVSGGKSSGMVNRFWRFMTGDVPPERLYVGMILQ